MRYNYDWLQNYCNENNIILLKDYSNEIFNSKIRIQGKCIVEHCEEYFEKLPQNLIKTGGYCKKCSEKIRKEKSKQTCLEKYGVENPFQNPIIKEKIKQYNLTKYGVENPSQSQEIKEKKIQTSLKNYGVEYHFQNSEIKEKSIQTCLEKYGVENPFQNPIIKEKIKQYNLTKYGVENPSQSQEIKEKKIQTSLKNYGVEHPSQNAEISEKSSKNAYLIKNYTYPSGKIIKVQGYEHFALDELIYINQVCENDIVTNRTEVPTIWYQDKSGKKRRYFVDIYLSLENRCIEVKSTWTMEKKYDNILEKMQAVKDAGYECEILIFNKTNFSF